MPGKSEGLKSLYMLEVCKNAEDNKYDFSSTLP